MMKKGLHGLLALAACTFGLVVMAQCPVGTTQVTIYSSDFEADDGGLVRSTGGDWEYGVIPVIMDSSACEYWHESPGGAHSGIRGWGTVLNNCHHNLGASSTLTLTVDLSNPSYQGATLEFAHWYEVFVSFDYVYVTVNGSNAYMNNSQEYSGGWVMQEVDLTSYLGQASVQIGFSMYASTVVALAGWYIDDVSVTACTSVIQGITENGTEAFKAWPVPARDVLHVEPAGPVTGWVLYDATGRVLKQAEQDLFGYFDIDLPSFQGMGVLELRMKDGIHRQRIIME